MQRFSWFLDEGKFLTPSEILRLLNLLNERKAEAEAKGTKTAIRDWFVINLALHTGLRVVEITSLNIADIYVDNGNSSLLVRNGKNGKPRLVKFGHEFRRILFEYLSWKKNVSEPLGLDAPVIFSNVSKSNMSKRGIQKIFERNAINAGIEGHSIHHLRHTYASFLYKSSKYNLRLVQKQLGHSSIRVTEIYADILRPDLDIALNDLYEELNEH